MLSSSNNRHAICLANETWQHNSVQFSLLAGAGERERVSVRVRVFGSVCPFGPSFWPFSQSNECESEGKGSQGPQRARHCLNDFITIHLFPLHLFHLHIPSPPHLIPQPPAENSSFSVCERFTCAESYIHDLKKTNKQITWMLSL